MHERLTVNQKKTRKLRLAAALEDCYAALRALPEHAVSVRDHLASLGVDFKAIARSGASGPLDAVHDDAEEDMSKSVSNPADIPYDYSDRIPLCSTTVVLLCVERLKSVLYEVDNVTFTEHSIKALIPKGRRQASKSELLHCIELATSWAPDMPLNAVKSMRFLNSMARAAADDLGNRTQRMRLPPNWDLCGVYRKTVKDNVLTVHHRFSGLSITVELESDLADRVSEFEITKNWSEHGATLVLSTARSRYCKLLAVLFAEVSQTKPPMVTKYGLAKVPPLALDNGAVLESESQCHPRVSKARSAPPRSRKTRRADCESEGSIASSSVPGASPPRHGAAMGSEFARSPSSPHDAAAPTSQPSVDEPMRKRRQRAKSSCASGRTTQTLSPLRLPSVLPRGGCGVDESAVEPPPPPPLRTSLTKAFDDIDLMEQSEIQELPQS